MFERSLVVSLFFLLPLSLSRASTFSTLSTCSLSCTSTSTMSNPPNITPSAHPHNEEYCSMAMHKPSDTRSSRSWLCAINWIKSGNQKIPETCVALWHYKRVLPLQQVLCVCRLCDGDLQGKLYFHLPTKPPCSTRVDVLETGNVPFLFSLPQMKNLGTTVELDPKGDKITCQAFGLHSSPAEYSTMGHIVLDLTSRTYQPNSRERSTRPKRRVTFALTEK